MVLVLVIVLLLLCFGAWPTVPWTWHAYGYGPSGILGVVLIVLLILVLLGRI